MSLLARVESDRNAARRARDGESVTSLGMLLAALQDATKVGGPLSGTEEIALLKRERKRRVEASEAFRAGGRLDQAAQEDRELEIIDGYLPAALSDQDLAALVDAAIAETGAMSLRDLGAVMRLVMERAAGRADGKAVSDLARARLAG